MSQDWSLVNAENMTNRGCPFQNSELILEKELVIKRSVCNVSLHIEKFHAAAAKIIIDDKEEYLYWNRMKNYPEIPKLDAGVHKIKCEVYPSDFSTYGPLNYIYGDTHMVPPAHFSGKCGLFDPIDAPQITWWDHFNFRKLGVGQIVLKK